MHLLKNILAFLRFVFDFKKPAFLEFEYITLIIDEKPLFLVYWKVKKYYKVTVLDKSYKKQTGSHILQIPANLASVDIVVKNVWNRRKQKLSIVYTKLDEVSAGLLFKEFKPITRLYITTPQVKVKQLIAAIKFKKVSPKRLNVYLPKRFNLDKIKFNYP